MNIIAEKSQVPQLCACSNLHTVVCRHKLMPVRRQVRRAAEESKGDAQVVREFNEADGKVTEPAASKDGNFYNDERPVRRCGLSCSGCLVAKHRLLQHWSPRPCLQRAAL